MQPLTLLWIALLLPTLCLAQAPQPVSVEFGPGSDWDKADSRSSDPKYQDVHERAKTRQAYSLRIRSITVEGPQQLQHLPPALRSLIFPQWLGQVPLPIAVGDMLTPQKLFDAMEALERTITKDAIQGYGLRSKGEVGVLYIEVDYDTTEPPADAQPTDHTVGVIFRPYYIHFSLVRIGDNVLPIPRSPLPTLYDNVPKPLLGLKPTFGISHDRAFGTALSGAFETDLLHLPDLEHLSNAPHKNHHLDVHGQGMKSLEELFYRANTGLRYSYRQSGTTVQEFSLRADYDGIQAPLGDGKHTRHAGVGSVGVRLKLVPNTRLSLDTGYRWTDDTTDSKEPALRTRTSANEQTNRVLFDAIPRPVYGFLRAAIWEENGWLTGAGGVYQRLAGRLGYAKEIPLTLNQTIGLELLAGGGIVWGKVPAHARFFGGNTPGQFLYDSPSAGTLLHMPAGPLIRSLGEGEAGFSPRGGGVRGGDAFWHVNVNLTFPIRPWSYALIPNEPTDIPDVQGNPLTLKELLSKQINVTGPNMLAATLKAEGMSDAEANAKAWRLLAEVRPATQFIINNANLYAIKPLLMVDVAGMTGSSSASTTWLAAGGGVQLTIVIAKFEAGYMHTFSGPTFGNRGNVFVRLVFENLF